MKKRYILGFIVLFGVLLVLGCLALVYLRLRGSTLVKPSRALEARDVMFYYQKDKEWSSDYLGGSSFQMGGSGCLTACIASVLSMEDREHPVSPKELNAYFSDRDVYDAQGNIQWEAMERTLDLSVAREAAMDSAGLEELLFKGICPIVRVRVNGIGNFHYVLVVGSNGSSFLCMDPLSQDRELIPLSVYHNRIYAVRYLYKNTSARIRSLPDTRI